MHAEMMHLRELKRRKVLHTLSLYVVGCWVVLQVVEVLSGAGLPPATMRYVLIAMSAGFPLVLVAAWFYDVSTQGVQRTAARLPGEETPSLNLGDYSLVAGLAAVIVLNAYILSLPAPSGESAATAVQQRTLAILAFDDLDLGANGDPIGDVVAGELRDELTRAAGLKVLGPETSRAIQLSGAQRNELATELGVTSILTGDVQLTDGKLELHTKLIGMPAGNIVWQSEYESPVSEGADLQSRVLRAVLDVILPAASASMTHAPRMESGECRDVYELYLRGKQLAREPRGMELLQEAVRIDENCAVAWEAIAVANVNWTIGGFAKAGAAARRALEINDSLPEAWSVLAEIAEQEKRWNESEELFLRALYLDPTNTRANMMYSEALLARGRVRESLRYALEAYRHEPAYVATSWRVVMSARYLGDAELMTKYAEIYYELSGGVWRDGYWDDIAEAHIIRGDVERAAAIYDEHLQIGASWYPTCIRALKQVDLHDGLRTDVQLTADRYKSGVLGEDEAWHVIRCATWIGETDIVIDIVSDDELPTEKKFFVFFQADSGILRQTPYFRNLATESGLLDYWRKWGWSDYCRPDGESFQCD